MTDRPTVLLCDDSRALRMLTASQLADRTRAEAEDAHAQATKDVARLLEEAREEAARIVNEARSNAEFLMQVQKTTPVHIADD